VAAFAQDFICPSVGSVWAQLVQFHSDWLRNLPASFTLTLTTKHGYRAIRWQANFNGNTYDYYFCCTDLLAAVTCSLRHIAGSPGWRTIPNYQDGIAGAASLFVTTWRGVMQTCRRSIWTTWAGATLGSVNQRTTVNEAAQYQSYLDFWYCEAGYEVLVDATLIYGWLNANSIAFLAGKGPGDGLDAVAAPVGIDLTNLTRAVEDISNARMDVSLHNGAVVASITGGTVIP